MARKKDNGINKYNPVLDLPVKEEPIIRPPSWVPPFDLPELPEEPEKEPPFIRYAGAFKDPKLREGLPAFEVGRQYLFGYCEPLYGYDDVVAAILDSIIWLVDPPPIVRYVSADVSLSELHYHKRNAIKEGTISVGVVFLPETLIRGRIPYIPHCHEVDGSYVVDIHRLVRVETKHYRPTVSDEIKVDFVKLS